MPILVPDTCKYFYHDTVVENTSNVASSIYKTNRSYTIKNTKGVVVSKLNYYNYKMKNFDWVLLANVETNPDYRGHGLASKLIKELYIDITKKDPKKGIYLFVRPDNDTAINVYKKQGFKEVRRYKLEDGWYIIMCKGNADIKQIHDMNFR